jgi:SET family sugar efflux transporter-like MFS transporter
MQNNRVEGRQPHIRRLIAPLASPTVLRSSGAMFLLGVASAIVLPYASLFALSEVRMTPVQFGLYSGSASLSGVLCSLLIGQWTDSHGRRELWLMASLLAGMAAYGIFATTSTFSVIFCVAVSLIAVFTSTTAQFLALARARLDSVYERAIDLPMGIIRAAFSLARTTHRRLDTCHARVQRNLRMCDCTSCWRHCLGATAAPATGLSQHAVGSAR